jgi:hydroxyacyl-ACP dehydratase HTD2-like protein with hotdog domain
MWAGGEIEFRDALRVGDESTRTSRISDVTVKIGSTGQLCFVSVEHTVTSSRGVAIRERQDIVYREMTVCARKSRVASARRTASRDTCLRLRAAVPLFGADFQRPPNPL